MFDTHIQHNISRKVACQELGVSVDSDLVTGEIRGIRVTYVDRLDGWKITFAGSPMAVAFEVVRVVEQGKLGTFEECYQADGMPKEAGIENFHEMIMEVSPTRILCVDDRLVLTKTYPSYRAEPEILRAAIALGTDLVLAVQSASTKFVPSLDGAPYREAAQLAIKDKTEEIDRFNQRRRKRARHQTAKRVLLVLGFIVMWPVALVFWARARRRS